MNKKRPIIGIIMGSQHDLDVMVEAAKILEDFSVAYEIKIVSAHRTPDVMTKYANSAAKNGLKVIIAGAGGSAHLPGMTASETLLPVIAVPIKREHHDHEALWSNIKMPQGIPLATMPENGAANAALFSLRILALDDKRLLKRLEEYRKKLHADVSVQDKQLQKDGWEKFLHD